MIHIEEDELKLIHLDDEDESEDALLMVCEGFLDNARVEFIGLFGR